MLHVYDSRDLIHVEFMCVCLKSDGSWMRQPRGSAVKKFKQSTIHSRSKSPKYKLMNSRMLTRWRVKIRSTSSEQIQGTVLKPEANSSNSRKRKAKVGRPVCEAGPADDSGKGTENDAIGLRANRETGEPTGYCRPNEAANRPAQPRAVHVAEATALTSEATAQRADTLSPVAEAFWDLLEQAGYTVWRD